MQTAQQPKPAQQDPFFDFNKPLISSTGVNHVQQAHQMDTFKTLYSNVAQKPVVQNVFPQQQQQLYTNRMGGMAPVMGDNAFVSGMGQPQMPGGFNQFQQTNQAAFPGGNT